jgi:hypothetical protein
MIHYNLVACVQAFNKACICIKDKKKICLMEMHHDY